MWWGRAGLFFGIPDNPGLPFEEIGPPFRWRLQAGRAWAILFSFIGAPIGGQAGSGVPSFRPDSARVFPGFVPVLFGPVEGGSGANFSRENGLHGPNVSKSLFNPQIRRPGTPGDAAR